jgi:hypothetical protein
MPHFIEQQISPNPASDGVIFEPDPRGIGFAYHRASTEILRRGTRCEAVGLRAALVQKKKRRFLKV